MITSRPLITAALVGLALLGWSPALRAQESGETPAATEVPTEADEDAGAKAPAGSEAPATKPPLPPADKGTGPLDGPVPTLLTPAMYLNSL